jgi:hypothetical protein
MSARMRQARGAATVELAVSMIFLVPLIMYMFFLQDMLLMKLNGQEAAVQAPWDYSVLNYEYKYNNDTPVGQEIQSGAGSPGQMSRLTYCDHSAAFDSYTLRDCDDLIHHQSMAAHECWIGDQGGSFSGQVRCSVGFLDPTMPTGAATAAVAAFGNGGIVNCNQRLGIMNYYLPNKFLTTFRGGEGFSVNADGNGTAKRKMESRWARGNTSNAASGAQQDQVHTPGGGGDVNKAVASGSGSAGSNYWRLKRTENAMLVDPWAVTLSGGQPLGRINPNVPSAFSIVGPGSHPIHARIQAAYSTQNGAVSQAERYSNTMQQAGFLNGNTRQDGQGDNLTTAAAAFRPNDAQQQFGDHWAGQWSDGRVQRTAGNRGRSYFGNSSW